MDEKLALVMMLGDRAIDYVPPKNGPADQFDFLKALWEEGDGNITDDMLKSPDEKKFTDMLENHPSLGLFRNNHQSEEEFKDSQYMQK